MIDFSPKKLSTEEVNCTANDRGRLGLIKFLERFK